MGVLYSCKLLDAHEFIVRDRNMGQILEKFNAFQRLEVIMAQKNLPDIDVSLLLIRIKGGDVELADLAIV